MLTNTLIIDKRKELPAKYKKILEDKTNEVTISSDIKSALNLIKTKEPDVIIISDSIEENLADFCSKIRVLTYNMRPVIIATSKSAELDDRINILKAGADDFISEPINAEEFKMRIIAHLRREYESYVDLKTNLPNGNYCMRALKRCLSEQNNWGALLIKINEFAVYKSVYTELASDKLIKTFIAIMFSGLDENDFLGSINENEFLIITNSYKLEKVASFLTFAFDSVKEKFYSNDDVKRGYMLIHGNEYAGKRGEFVSISVGGISSEFSKYDSVESVLKDLMSANSISKKPNESSYLIQRPRISTPNSVLKHEENKKILIIEEDTSMQILLSETLKLEGFETSLPEMVMNFDEYSPALIILDAGTADDKTGVNLCKHLKEKKGQTKIIVTSNSHDKESILSAGADFYLPKPYEISTLIKWVKYFIKEVNE